MNEQATRFRIGIFVLAMLVLLALLITLFTGFPTFFKRHNQYTVILTNAAGVGPGTPVRRSGVRIGEVKKLTLDDKTGQVRVEILVEKQHPLREGDRAVLVHGLLGGDTNIDFLAPEGQPPDRPTVEPGAEFVGAAQPDVSTLLNQTSALMPSTAETLNEMRKSLQRFDQMAPQMDAAFREHRDFARASRELIPELRRSNDELQVTARNWGKLGERLDVLLQTNEEKLVKALDNLNTTLMRISTVFNEENQRNLAVTLKNVRAGSENLESISRNTDALLQESRQTVRRINDSVTRADEVLHNLQQTTKPMAERSESVMKNLDESTNEARQLLHALNQADGTLRRFAVDPSLYNNLNEAACMIARLMPRLDRILHDLEVFADKIARHPESLGVGGVVHPSSGLKEAPAGSSWPRH